MKIVHLIKHDPDIFVQKVMDEQRKSHDVHIVDLRENKDYDRIVDRIVSGDRVISW